MVFYREDIKQFHSFQEAISSACLFRQMRQKIKYGLAPATIAKRGVAIVCGEFGGKLTQVYRKSQRGEDGKKSVMG